MVDKPCLTPDCKALARWRGLCSRCYGQAKKLIEKELTDWDELITMGLALHNTDQLFTAEFHKRKQLPRPDAEFCRHCGGVTVCSPCDHCGKEP